MSDGGKEKAPSWKKDAIAKRSGWCHPKTGEVLKCYGQLSDLRGAGKITSVAFEQESYLPNDDLRVIVTLDELCDVEADGELSVTVDGDVPIVLTCAAAEGVYEIVFEGGSVPNLDTTLSIAEQTLNAVIEDLDAQSVDLDLTEALVLAAGEREIVSE